MVRDLELSRQNGYSDGYNGKRNQAQMFAREWGKAHANAYQVDYEKGERDYSNSAGRGGLINF